MLKQYNICTFSLLAPRTGEPKGITDERTWLQKLQDIYRQPEGSDYITLYPGDPDKEQRFKMNTDFLV